MVTSWEICGYVLYTIAGAGMASGAEEAAPNLLGSGAIETPVDVKFVVDLVKSGALICG